MGFSLDWTRERFTLDGMLSKAVREVFVSLYEQGLAYRGDYIVNWCPRCVTALSDLEVVTQAEPGSLWHIRYRSLDGGDGHRRGDDAARDPPWRHGRGRSSRGRALCEARRHDRCGFPCWAERSRWWPTPSSTGSSGRER